MTGFSTEVQPINPLQVGNDLQRSFIAKRSLPFESVEYDAFEEIAERHIVVLGQPLEDLQDPPLDAYARLHTIDDQLALAGPRPRHGSACPEIAVDRVLPILQVMGEHGVERGLAHGHTRLLQREKVIGHSG